ncbi:MAG TPA: outer membrane beta-barrel protein, partial [Puia sp.]|nr:outer membrane beta-barrel protein [Puia sp.]
MVYGLLLIAVHQAKAQLPTIRGIVRDSITKQVLGDATVSLLRQQKLIRQVRSGRQGFVFQKFTPGEYRLIISYQGYASDSLRVELDSVDKSIVILLHPSAKAMMQVVVTARIPPAIVRNDTIAFNAGAYPTRPNATVEDLLRKLPGIDIDKTGNVTMQGQKVDKIYLDGKEFFLNDPRVATQNLPADLVAQIEAFDSQTDQARLTGVKEMTDTKSINIKLKKDRKRGYFGKAYAGAGPAGSYSAGGTATNLGSSWLFGSGNANNINNQFTGQENRNGPGTGGVQTFNNGELNYRNDKSSRLAVTGNGSTSGSHTVLNQESSTQTALTDSSLLENRSSKSTSNTQATQGNLFLEYKINNFSQLSLRSAISNSTGSTSETDSTSVSTVKTQSSYLNNQGKTVNSSLSNDFNVNNQLNYRLRGRRPGRTLFVSLSQSHDQQNQPQNTYSLVNNFDSSSSLLSQTLINQKMAQTATSDNYGGSVAYTEPLKPGHLLDLSYKLNYSTSRRDRVSNAYDSATGHYDRPDAGTSNHFTTNNTIQRVGAGYNAIEGKFQYQLGLSLQFSQLQNINWTVDSTLILRQTNWYPRASIIYSPGHGHSLKFTYTATTNSPTLQQLQPVADPTNPFLIKIGNPDLLQQLTHSVNLTYNSLNTHNFQNLQVGLQGSYNEHDITTATTILSGGIQEIKYINAGGVWNSSANITYGFPLGDQRKGNSSISVNSRYGRSVTEINGAIDVTNALGGGASWKVNYHPTSNLFVETQVSYSATTNHYSLNAAQTTTTSIENYSIDVSYLFPGAITVTSWYNLQITGPPSQSVSLWNAAI